MKSIADDVRALTRARVCAMTPSERIELALRLGDDDLELFARSSGLTREVALARLRAARRRGRIGSRAAECADA